MKSIPDHAVRGKFKLDIKSIGLLAYIGARYTSDLVFVQMGNDEESGLKIDARTFYDAYLSKEIGDRLRIFGGINNITEVTDEYMGPYVGREFYLGIEGKL